MIARRCMVALWGRYGALFFSVLNWKPVKAGRLTSDSGHRPAWNVIWRRNYQLQLINYNVFSCVFRVFHEFFRQPDKYRQLEAWHLALGTVSVPCPVLVLIQQLEPVRSRQWQWRHFHSGMNRQTDGWCWPSLSLTWLFHCNAVTVWGKMLSTAQCSVPQCLGLFGRF